jgi:hypothetical protein
MQTDQAVPADPVAGHTQPKTPPGALSGSAPVASPAVQRAAASPSRTLGLGAPLERAPAPATRIETVSLQEWAASRGQTATLGEQNEVRTESATPTAPLTATLTATPTATTDAPPPNTPVAQRLVGAPPPIATPNTRNTPQAVEPPRSTMPPRITTPHVQRAVQPEPIAAAHTRDTGSIAVAAGIAHRDADGSVVFEAPSPSLSRHDVQRAVDVEEMTRDTTSVTTATTGAAPPATASPTVTAPAPPTTAGTPNLEDLARRLYDPLAARLKAELRLDRERFGLVTDLHRP